MLSITSIVSVALLSGTVDEASSVSVRCYSRLPRKILFTNSPYVIMTSSTQTAKESCVSYHIISSLFRICTPFALHRGTCGAASGSNDDLFAASSTGGTDRRPCAGAEGAGHARHARVPAMTVVQLRQRTPLRGWHYSIEVGADHTEALQRRCGAIRQ